jgi:hypothetical protein
MIFHYYDIHYYTSVLKMKQWVLGCLNNSNEIMLVQFDAVFTGEVGRIYRSRNPAFELVKVMGQLRETMSCRTET